MLCLLSINLHCINIRTNVLLLADGRWDVMVRDVHPGLCRMRYLGIACT